MVRRLCTRERPQVPEISLERRSAVDFYPGGWGLMERARPVNLCGGKGSGGPGSSGVGRLDVCEADQRALLRPAKRKMSGQMEQLRGG